MKIILNKLTLVFIVLSSSLNAQKFSEDDFLQIVKSEQEVHAGKLNPAVQASTSDYDVKHYKCFWTVDPAVNYISGYITTRFKPMQAGFDSIAFNLNSALTVDSVKYHNQPRVFNHSSGLLSIVLPATIPVNTLDSITVYYKGIPTSSGFGSFIQDTHNSVPILWTLSEPYGASDWWPCKNDLTDKADSIDVYINTPNAYKGVSNGLLISITPNGSRKIHHWKHRYPIATYLICFSTTNYVKYSHWVPFAGDTLEVVNYVYPEDSLSASSQTGVIVSMIQLYDTLFGIYPFQNEKYGHAQFGWGVGMEHQTITFIGGFGYELLAHELGHHWFGDKTTCGSWEDIWLNEGFATYLSGLCYEHLSPSYWMQFKKGRINNITSQPDGSVWCDDTTSVNRIFSGRLTYAKGAMILHQLRWVIGDSAFYAAINNYLADVNCAYEFAKTNDLKAHFETSSGQNLTWYFNDWFTGQGFPSYQISWWQNSSNQVTFMVNQSQSHTSVPFFELPLPIKFKNSSQDTIIVANHSFSGQMFTANLSFHADSLLFDPDLWIISANNTVLTGIPENIVDNSLVVFPNPASLEVMITLPAGIKSEVSVQILDVLGRSYSLPFTRKNNSLLIDVSGMAAGIYSVILNVGEHRMSGKIVLNKD